MTVALSHRNSLVTYTLIALNVAVFVFMITVGKADAMNPAATTLAKMGGNVPALTTGGEWWRLLTAGFLHAGLIHLALNMFSLWNVGRFVEAAAGTKRYLVIYFVALLVGSIASLAFNSDMNVGVGASGAVFGVFGAYAVWLLLNRSRLDPQGWNRQMGELGIMLAINLIYGFTRSNIDNAAHIGGLLAGAGATFLLMRKR